MRSVNEGNPGSPSPTEFLSPDQRLDAVEEANRSLLLDAARGECGPDQQRIALEVIRWGALILRKNSDYGSSVWKRPVLAPDCDPGTAIRVRMSDKISRLESLLKRGGPEEVAGESVNDTLRDLGAYCLLELARPEDTDIF